MYWNCPRNPYLSIYLSIYNIYIYIYIYISHHCFVSCKNETWNGLKTWWLCQFLVSIQLDEMKDVSSCTAVKIACSSIFRFILAINTQCAVIDMQIILNDILHDLWIHMTVSSGPKSGFFFVGTLNFIMAIAQKIGHLEDWNRCHLHQLDLWIFSQKSFCPQTPW